VSASSPRANDKKPVGALELAAFAAPAGPLLALTLPTVIFLPPYFETHLGLEGWVVAAIFFAARSVDILLDPLLGSLQDRTETRWGRRRPWLVGACLPLMALVWVVFIGLGPGTSVFAASAAVVAMYFAFAFMMVAHLGWAGEIIPTYHGRTHVLGAVQVASLVGQVVMLVLAAYVVQFLKGTDADAVAAMGWTLIVMLPLTTAAAVLFARETKVPPQPHLGLSDAVRTVFANQVARRVLLPDLLLGIAQGVSGGLFLFYFQFILGFVQESQTLVAIYFVAGLLGVPVWWIAGRRLGKHRALQAAFLYTAATTLMLPFMPVGNFPVVAIAMVIAGLAQGGGVLLTRSLMADVVDDDELTTGSRRSGVYFGLLLMTSKVGLAAGPIAYGLVGLAGFSAQRGADNSALAFAALGGTFIGVPVLLNLLGALSLRRYPLDEARQAALAAAIAERHAENSANTLGPSTR
jgi:glycoside/pentoside/hexuronide:cation symporter, GPH family